MKTYKYLLVVLFLFFAPSLHAKDVEMADALRSNGKIYVVAVVAGIVSIIISSYMILLDRKISSLEKKVNSNNK